MSNVITCPKCGGSGQYSRAVTGGVSCQFAYEKRPTTMMDSCKVCATTGKVILELHNIDCSSCNGSGYKDQKINGRFIANAPKVTCNICYGKGSYTSKTYTPTY